MSTEQTSTPEAFTSETTTRGIRVRVRAEYAPDHSDPSHQLWRFVYTVTIANESTEPVQLISRHWVITDAADHVEEVKGLGVIGQQPALRPDESFEYTSICPLGTPSGSMHGTYQMVSAKGERFNAAIAPFGLAAPYTVH